MFSKPVVRQQLIPTYRILSQSEVLLTICAPLLLQLWLSHPRHQYQTSFSSTLYFNTDHRMDLFVSEGFRRAPEIGRPANRLDWRRWCGQDGRANFGVHTGSLVLFSLHSTLYVPHGHSHHRLLLYTPVISRFQPGGHHGNVRLATISVSEDMKWVSGRESSQYTLCV